MENNNKKPYKIRFEDKEKYLFANVSGENDNFEISRQFWLEIAEECKKKNCKRILVFEEIKEVVSATEMYKIAAEIPEMGFTGVRIAFVDRYLEQQGINEFGSMVAGNRGLIGKIFNNVKEAEEWLLKN